jgi:hypothetical protein
MGRRFTLGERKPRGTLEETLDLRGRIGDAEG